jgi:hypothetical protein
VVRIRIYAASSTHCPAIDLKISIDLDNAVALAAAQEQTSRNIPHSTMPSHKLAVDALAALVATIITHELSPIYAISSAPSIVA